MGAEATPRRERGRWLNDLACIAAAGMASRPLAWAAVVAVSAAAGLLVIGTRGTALAVSSGLVLAGLDSSRRAPLRRITRTLLLLSGIVGLVALTTVMALARLGSSASTQMAEGLFGLAVIAICCAIAASWTGRVTRSVRTRDRVLLVLALLALAVAVRPDTVYSTYPAFRWPLHGAVVFEITALLLLARVARRGPWIAWTLFTAAALTAAQWDVRGSRDEVVMLAGPIAVVLAARITAALRERVTGGDADAAVARLSRAVQWHPWRSAIVASCVAFVISLSLWMSVTSGSPISISSQRGLEIAFFAIPGPFALVIAIVFHALDRESAFVDRIACALAPLLALVAGFGTLILAVAVAEGRSPAKGVRFLLTYTGIGPLLPALTGFVVRRREHRRTAAWPTIAMLACAALLVIASAGPEYLVSNAMEYFVKSDVLHSLAPLCAIPWLLAFHRLVATEVALRTLLRWGIALAAVTGLGVGALYPDAMYIYPSSRYAAMNGIRNGLVAGSAATVLVAYMNGLAAFGVILARRLRDVTALPEDHAVLHWKEAIIASNAAQSPTPPVATAAQGTPR